MSSRRHWRKLFIVQGFLALAAGNLVVLSLQKPQKRPRRRIHVPYRQHTFNIDDLHNDEAIGLLRFSVQEIRWLTQIFELHLVPFPNRISCPPETAMTVVLYRLSNPIHYNVMKSYFGRSSGWLSTVFTATITYLVRRYQRFLQFDRRRLTFETISRYCDAIYAQGGPDLVWGFVDGTTRDICRPTPSTGLDQRDYYSGYTKTHCLKYQGLATPDGLISSIYGPVSGKTHDARLWRDTNIESELREVFADLPREEVPLVYGDMAYKASSYGLTGALPTDRQLDPLQARYNRFMSEFRVSVENSFGNVSSRLWRSLGFTIGQSAGLSAVGAIYLVSVLLANCHNCLHPNQISTYFECQPPSLREYLGAPEDMVLA